MPLSSLFRQKQTSAAGNLPLKISLTAKDVVEEWHTAAHSDICSQSSATNHIMSQTSSWLETGEDLPYELFVYRKYDSIIKVVKDETVRSGDRENRPCYKDKSKLHKLECGHFIYTQVDERPCGRNCEQGAEDGQAFFCTLCFRSDRKSWDDLYGQRWHAILLPLFTDPQLEQRACLQSSSFQHVEPAYLDPDGYILLPRVHCVISMVLVWEKRREVLLKNEIRDILGRRGATPSQIGHAEEYFEHLLTFQDRFLQADMHIMAALAVHHHFSRRGQSCSPESILSKVQRDICPKWDEYVQLTSECMDTWAITLAVQEMRQGLSSEDRASLWENQRGGLPEALSVWREYVAGSPRNFMTWSERKRYAAWCLARASPDSRDFDDTYRMLLASVGVEQHGVFDAMVKGDMKVAVAERDEVEG